MNFEWIIPDDKRISSIKVSSPNLTFIPATLIFGGSVMNDEKTVRSFSHQQVDFSRFIQTLKEDGENIANKITYSRKLITIQLSCDWEPEYYLAIQNKFKELWPN